MIKQMDRKVWIAAALVAAALLVWVGIYIFSSEVTIAEPDAPAAITVKGFPVDQKDARVYSVIEKYLNAQIENDKIAVKELFSKEQLEAWTDNSYLITDTAFEVFDEVKIGSLKMGVITFNKLEDRETGAALAVYSVQFINEGKVKAEVELREEVGLGLQDGIWLIDSNYRTILES